MNDIYTGLIPLELN